MGQFNSRLFVMVKGASVWKKLQDITLKKYGIDSEATEVFDTKKKSIVLEGFSCEDDKLNRILSTIHMFYQFEADMQEIDNPTLRMQVKKLEEDKEKLIIQLVDYEELKSENERLRKQLERRT